MKNTTKFLALLLAGLLSVSMLFACTDDSYSSDDDEEDEETDFSDYEDLDPEEVWEEIEDADQVKISWQRFNGSTGSITKDGKKAAFDPNGAVIYYDYDNEKEYIPNEDGSHHEQYLLYSWTELLDMELKNNFFKAQELGFFLEDDWYEKSGSLYSATEETLDAIDLECESITAYMKDKGTTYTFVCETVVDGEEQTAECKIEFKDVSVKLPGSDDTVTTTVPGPGAASTTAPIPSTQKPDVTEKPDNPHPPVTEAPDVPVPPVTEKPDDPVPPETEAPDLPANAKTPGQLFAETKNAGDATVNLKYKLNGVTYQYTFEKNGNLFLWKETNSGIDYYYNYYYDNNNNRQYYLGDNNQWYYITDHLDWSGLLDSVNNVLEGVLTMNNSCFEYDADQNSVKMIKSYAEQLGVRGVEVRLNSYGDQYTMSIVYNDFSTSTFSVKFSVFSAIRLPSAQPAPDAPVTEDTPDYTDYSGMAPSEIYNAIMNAKDITITVTGGSADANYIKHGDIVYVSTNGTAVYIDFAAGLAYAQQGGQWVSVASPYESWSTIVGMMQLSPNTYCFVDSYYNSFSSYDTELTIQSSLLVGSGLASVTLLREGNSYTLIEEAANGTSSYLSFCFDPVELNLPM